MSQIIHNVTTIIDHSVHEEWLAWTKAVYIPEIMATDSFLEVKILKILEDHNPDGFTYAIQFTADSFAQYIDYTNQHSTRIELMMKQRYEGHYASFSTSMRVVE